MMKRHPFFEPDLEIPAKDLEFFSSQPCAAPYLNSPHYEPVPFITRHATTDGSTSNKFFNKVINTEGTIPHLLSMVRKSIPNDQRNATDKDANPDFIVFVHWGPDVCGFQDTVHGGVLASLLDEALGLCAEADERVSKGDVRLYTAGLDIAYRAPVMVPGIAVIKTWVRRKEGRKWFLEAQLFNEEGKIQAEAKSLYIGARMNAAL